MLLYPVRVIFYAYRLLFLFAYENACSFEEISWNEDVENCLKENDLSVLASNTEQQLPLTSNYATDMHRVTLLVLHGISISSYLVSR